MNINFQGVNGVKRDATKVTYRNETFVRHIAIVGRAVLKDMIMAVKVNAITVTMRDEPCATFGVPRGTDPRTIQALLQRRKS